MKNITHTGLKRVLVGEGIAVEVTGARDVSLFHTYPFVLPVNRSLVLNEDRSHYWPFRDSFCTLLPHLHISGPASLIAYKTRNSNAYIETKYLSQDMIELLSEKCYTRHLYKKRSFPIGSLNPRLALLDKLMKNFIDESILQNGVLGFLKGDITASTLILFELEIERDVGEKDNLAGTLTEWRTKPRTQRVHFDVVARVEDDRLKPLVVKKFRPFISSDSAAWSTLMSNLSFTKFPSLLVPPEALTLDVKW
ncbi:hypothetical protein GIB67_015927 [Kingdonia uniflora]|uniref:Uncharacterized protein n=1 Tax=Kingdonia uniflora TaxID=39325 RepID=A0A7J7PCP4_9MAGN|nr:hypothetical protein GIB67_015927 [Kingdonia uniflora]